jgi:hypothetical protein
MIQHFTMHWHSNRNLECEIGSFGSAMILVQQALTFQGRPESIRVSLRDVNYI